MSLKAYLTKYEYPDLVFDYINLRALVDASLPIFLIASVGGAKSVLIQSVSEYCKRDQTMSVQSIERVSPMRLLGIQKRINGKHCLLVTEDYSTLGDDDEMSYKTALIVSKLSYDKTYVDPMFTSKNMPNGLVIEVKSLAFLCGMQPYWLSAISSKKAFETIIGEKILRYYRIPIMTREQNAPSDTIKEYLKGLQWTHDDTYETTDHELRLLRDALIIQAAQRSNEYAPMLLNALKRYIPADVLLEWIKQLACRFSIEKKLMLRYYPTPISDLATTQVLHKEYMVLFATMWYNPMTYKDLATHLKIRGENDEATRQHISFMVDLAKKAGMVYTIRLSKETRIYPMPEYQELSLHAWRAPKQEDTEPEKFAVPNTSNTNTAGILTVDRLLKETGISI